MDKENIAPRTSSDPLNRQLSPAGSLKKNGRKGRSKSIGPGSLEEAEAPKQSAKDRRKSAFVPATKSILSKNEESEKAARRKSMMNRRVSFAPEATLHTWDIVEYAKDHTTSTDDSESTRRASSITRSSSSPGPSSDASQDEEDADLLSPAAAQQNSLPRQKRRSSGIPPMNFNNPDDAQSSGVSESDESASGEDEAGSGDETGTAMSLDVDEATMQSPAQSDSSTSSSARLERALQQAAQAAGTRGIEYDEYGDMSMELAQEEVTNAFKPWAQMQPSDAPGSASFDQENINPFSPAFKAQVQQRPSIIAEEEEEEADMSMDVTRAVGGIVTARPPQLASSPSSDASGDGTMELTQAVGKITGQKRRRSDTKPDSPGKAVPTLQPKRRRSSVARSSMGDDTMDLTMAVGGIKSTGSPKKSQRRRSLRSRRSSGAVSDASDGTMDLTQAVGGITAAAAAGDDSFDGNEELSMELTTVIGGIKAERGPSSANGSRPVTPQKSQFPLRSTVNTTPKDQERFKDTPDLGAKQLLTPVLKQQASKSAENDDPTGTALSARHTRVGADGQQPNLASAPQQQKLDAERTSPNEVPSANNDDVSYPRLLPVDQDFTPGRTSTSRQTRSQSPKTPQSLHTAQGLASQQGVEQSPTAAKQQRSSPGNRHTLTPEKLHAEEGARDLTNSLKLMTTPRKEPLKSLTPKKQTSIKQPSPVKSATPKRRSTPQNSENRSVLPSPVRRLNEDLERIRLDGQETEKIGLQDFLGKAGIRFMDLTTTKRRLTVAPTPSRARESLQGKEDIDLEGGVVAAACTVPELELYQHACHELKRYTKEGKQMISQLEAATARDQPPLIRAYMHASPARKATLDAQMRDMKTHARLQSKALWYAWRSQLLDELMGGLQTIGEGLIKDDETLGRSEETIEQLLPKLTDQRASLQQEAQRLEQSVHANTEEEKQELDSARQHVADVRQELDVKRRILEDLRRQVQEQDSEAEHLKESKEEFTSAIQEANRVREACQGVSLKGITALKESVNHIEETFGWSIASASSQPPTVTMTYKSELQLFFHPKAFQQSSIDEDERPNAPIRLLYIADSKRPLTTTLRFFLQFLQATLHALPQCTTKISSLLALVSNGWTTACSIAESERRLNIETLTDAKIVSDERLAIESTILLPDVRTKVRATFAVEASVSPDLQMRCGVDAKVLVVYGEQYNEKNMSEFLRGLVGEGIGGWDRALRALREKLIARGAKGVRK